GMSYRWLAIGCWPPRRFEFRFSSFGWLSGLLQVQGVVKEAGEEAAGKRADPVDAVAGPVGRSESGAEGASRIERGAGEGSGDENAESDAEADAKAGDGFEGAALVDGGSENGEHEEEGCDCLEGHRGEAREVASKLRSADSDGAPGVVGDD